MPFIVKPRSFFFFFFVCLKICRECFYEVFEEEIHQVIVKNHLFKSGERVAIGASGGKGHFFLLQFSLLRTF